jgi:hypothetical protein
MQIPSNIEDTLGEESPDRKKAKSVSVPFRSAADVVRPVVVTPVGTKSEPAAAVPVRR